MTKKVTTEVMDQVPEQASEPEESGLSFTDNISLTWEQVDHPLDELHLALVNESNEAFLRAVSAIGEHAKDSVEENTSLSQEVARLDLKLNLLLDLVSQLVYRQLELPEVTCVTLTSNEVSWEGSNLPELGAILFVQAYVQRGTPKPLCFYGKVVSAESGVARVEYLGLSGSAKMWVEKLIFRHHRRQVAFKKRVD